VVCVGSLRQEFLTIDATLYLGINEHIESILNAIEQVAGLFTDILFPFRIALFVSCGFFSEVCFRYFFLARVR
jgi:hypothetical protein